MTIKFIEERQLGSGKIVTKGTQAIYTPEEEKAFVDNGVAVFVTEERAGLESAHTRHSKKGGE